MEIKNLYDPSVKQEIIARINALTPQSTRQWGKMDVAQMLAHVQVPIGVALGDMTIKGNWMMKMFMPLFKKMLFDERPWKLGLPTDKSFVMTGQIKDFEKEKAQLLEKVNRFTEANVVCEKHPVFGRFTKEQWSKASWKHLDHHFRQFGV